MSTTGHTRFSVCSFFRVLLRFKIHTSPHQLHLNIAFTHLCIFVCVLEHVPATARAEVRGQLQEWVLLLHRGPGSELRLHGRCLHELSLTSKRALQPFLKSAYTVMGFVTVFTHTCQYVFVVYADLHVIPIYQLKVPPLY